MSGTDARRGFSFQDLVLIRRLLDDLMARRAAVIGGGRRPKPRSFRIEATMRWLTSTQSTANGAPAWDLVEEFDRGVVVDEVKGGLILKASERWTFWARLRQTLANAPRDLRFIPRLTFSDTLHTPNYWEGWRAQTITTTARLPESVRSTQSAIAEAWFVLTAPLSTLRLMAQRRRWPCPDAPPVREARARQMIHSMIVDRLPAHDVLELSILEDLGQATDPDVAPTLLLWMRGHTAKLAISGPQRLDACKFEREIAHVTRLMRVSPRCARDWRALQAAVLPESALPGTGRLPVHHWRQVQPKIAAHFDSRSRDDQRVLMIIGHSGLGKSIILAQLARERAVDDLVVWIDSTVFSAERAQRALELGTWLAAYRRKRLMVVLDQLDECTKAVALMNTVVQVARVSSRVDAFAGLRETTAAGVDERTGWQRLTLDPWPEKQVGDLVPSAPPDLVQLLRTPLLLDLYLDLVNVDRNAVASLPADRMSVVGTWLAMRILPPSHPESPRRRHVLNACVKQVLLGARQWSLRVGLQRSAMKLYGLGLLRGEAGTVRFRHALLRDAVVALVLSDRDEQSMIHHLAECRSRLVRHDVLRAIVESTMSLVGLKPVGVRLKLGLVVDAAIDSRLPIVSALAELALSLAEHLPTVLARVDLARLLESARASRNGAWIRLISTLPTTSRPVWLSHDNAVRQLYGLIFWGGHDGLDPAIGIALAERVRSWLVPADNTDSWQAEQLTRLVARMLPDNITLKWLASFNGRLRMHISEMRDLGRNARDELPADAFARMFLASIDLSDADVCEDNLLALVTLDKQQGILASQPRAGARILFEMSVRAVDMSAAHTVSRGGLVNDTSTWFVREWSPHNAWPHAWTQLHSLCVKIQAIALIAVEEAQRSPSMSARLALLHSAKDWSDPALADSLLQSSGLYATRDCDHVIDESLTRRYAELATSERRAIDSFMLLRGIREETASPPLTSVRRDRSFSVPKGGPLPLDEELLQAFGLELEQASTMDFGAFVARNVLSPVHRRRCAALVAWIDRWPNSASVHTQSGLAQFIEALTEAMVRVSSPDLSTYVRIVERLWRAWLELAYDAKFHGSGMEIGWFLRRLDGTEQPTAVRMLAPTLANIVLHGSGNDLRAFSGDIAWETAGPDLIELLAGALLTRLDTGECAQSDRWISQGIEYLIKGLLDAPTLRDTIAESLLSALEANRWIYNTADLYQKCLERARALTA